LAGKLLAPPFTELTVIFTRCENSVASSLCRVPPFYFTEAERGMSESQYSERTCEIGVILFIFGVVGFGLCMYFLEIVPYL